MVANCEWNVVEPTAVLQRLGESAGVHLVVLGEGAELDADLVRSGPVQASAPRRYVSRDSSQG